MPCGGHHPSRSTGSNPWNCWLHFGGAAGPLHTKAELQKFCDIFTDRLRRLYDVAV